MGLTDTVILCNPFFKHRSGTAYKIVLIGLSFISHAEIHVNHVNRPVRSINTNSARVSEATLREQSLLTSDKVRSTMFQNITCRLKTDNSRFECRVNRFELKYDNEKKNRNLY